MILILAETHDPLAGILQTRIEERGQPVRRLSERELMEETPIAVERDGRRFGGFLRLPGGDVGVNDLSGVLVRISRRWWPSPAFDPPDQMFVYHETTAALFCLLAGLSCPVVNRFDLGWWLCDRAYPELLREELGERLGLRLDGMDGAGSAGLAASVYAVDGRLIPASVAAAPLADHLAGRSAALAAWQASSGLRICRLDLLAGEEPFLERLDPCPSLADEAPDVTERVAAAALEMLS
ncbi:MAG TPA: hypothetical protein VKK31_09995 [Thermoanaerobaculia bacterium]|nr:hypothetical protein [Thermoanaerobaculia bacterium]